MSTTSKNTLDDVLNPEELESLGKPEETSTVPDAEITEWQDTTAVTAPASSIAASMDRFRAGNLTPSQASALEGFHSEFVDSGEQVVFVADEIREILEDQAYARLDEDERAYAVNVQPAEEALDVIREYDQAYAGDVEEDFWQDIESNRFVVPVNYNMQGVIPEAPMAVMGSSNLIMSEVDSELAMDEMLEDEERYGREDLFINTYSTSQISESDYHVEIAPPSDFDQMEYSVENGSLEINIDGNTHRVKNLGRGITVIGEEERNGRYTVKLG